MKKNLLLLFIFFMGMFSSAYSQSAVMCMQLGWEEMPVKWKVYEAIADTFNSSNPHLVNYLESPSLLKGPLYTVDAQLAGPLFSYGGIGFASARYRFIQDDSLGNEIRRVRIRTRNIWISAGIQCFIIKTRNLKISLASGLDFANLHTGANERATLRFGHLNENFIVSGRFFMNIIVGHNTVIGIKPYYLLPFYDANFYSLDQYFNPVSAAKRDRSAYRQNTKTFGLIITIGKFQEPDDF